MTNGQLVFGRYVEPTIEQKTLENEIKDKAKSLLDSIDKVPMPTEQKEAAKRDIVTGMMWAIKGLFVYDF